MRVGDGTELVGLAALWGASFLFTRIGAPEFGPLALSAVRVAGASALLLPWLLWRGEGPALRAHWRPIFVIGVTNSALPFLCFGYAALTITAGLSAIFNAASPLFGAVIAWWWLKDRLTPYRIAGLALGFAGVVGLAWDQAGVKAETVDGGAVGRAVAACLVGTLLYGFSASFAKKRLAGVAPFAVAAGSQTGAALFLLLPACLFWPDASPSAGAWAAAAALAVACTGAAYVLYFRLIAAIGPANAIAVTFLVPVFAVLWGWLFLGEQVGVEMAAGCAVIVAGTCLATGLIGPSRGRRTAVSAE